MDLISALAHRKTVPEEPSRVYTEEEVEVLQRFARGGGEQGAWARLELQRLEMSGHTEVLGSTI